MKTMGKTPKNAFFFCFFLLLVFSITSLEAQTLRSLDEIFPGLSYGQKYSALTQRGLRNTFSKNENPTFIPAANSQIDLLGAVMEKKPTQLVEALVVVPYSGRPLNLLDAYNAIGKIENISNYTVYSSSRGGRYIPLFEESKRLDNAKRDRPIPDPPPATRLPSSETIYFYLKDTFFGNTYFRGDLTVNRYGIINNITNSAAIRFLVFPVMGAEKFSTVLYVEPLQEGMLVYGMVGIDIPEFLVNMLNLTSDINRRLNVFINWLTDSFQSIT